MAIANLSDIDVRIRDAVTRQLEWDPEIDASAIGVAAKDGAVTLTGYIDTYAGKLAAERAAKGVRGVRSLELRSTVPDNVQATVHQGHITLTGEAMWDFQRRDAEKAVRHVRGVRGVANRIGLAPGMAARDVHHRIVEAFHRNADLDARHVTAHAAGDVVTLTGHVGTWLQRDIAERAAAGAPGIQASRQPD